MLRWMAGQFGKEKIFFQKDQPFGDSPKVESRLFDYLDQPQTLRVMLQAGARPDVTDAEGYPLLYRAIAEGELETAQIAMDFGADSNLQVTGHDRERDTDIRGMTALDRAIEDGNYTAIKMLVAPEQLDNQSESELIRYARKTLAQHTDLYRENDLKKNALMRIAFYNDAGALELVKGNITDINRPNSEGITPLMSAALSPDFDPSFFERLLEMGADINAADDNGDTLLMKLATGRDSYKADFGYFVRHGASLSAGNNEGRTALHHALSGPTTARSPAPSPTATTSGSAAANRRPFAAIATRRGRWLGFSAGCSKARSISRRRRS